MSLTEKTRRYSSVTKTKAHGATYTPTVLADFVASQMLKAYSLSANKRILRILDPAVGHGELLLSLLHQLPQDVDVEIHGFDTDSEALTHARTRLTESFPSASIDFRSSDFLEYALAQTGGSMNGALFKPEPPVRFDLMIANPPYVRTQIMGANRAQQLAKQFELTGRVDICYAFMLGMGMLLEPSGVAGIIVSNRFMTTKSGSNVRRAIRTNYTIRNIWDLGDTKIFGAAVLPAVVVFQASKCSNGKSARFTSIYETSDPPEHRAKNVIVALRKPGVVEIPDGRRFRVQQGELDNSDGSSGLWRVTNGESSGWLDTVRANTWRSFGNIGKIRVGVKTCADKVFIRSDWSSLPESERPELLFPLITHHAARQYKLDAAKLTRQILYPHETVNGSRRAADLSQFPRSKKYLEQHRPTLEGRRYVIDAGRNWYEIWVPQDPDAWSKPKLVFRDISEHPCFWIDLDGAVVNGDCYWMTADQDDELLWLALAVANSSFVEHFYDRKFNNKLYAGRRRYITQYVEKFPLPNPESEIGKVIISLARRAYDIVDSENISSATEELDRLVWRAFGLPIEEVTW